MVPVDREPWPSLGGQVCDWIEAHLVFGPGDLRGEPAVIDDEKRALIWRMYEVFPQGHPQAGRRRFKRAGLSLPKGSAKTELAAWLAAAELHADAPVRCAGWTKKGEPIGGPVTDPFVVLVAYTEEQSDELAYGALRAILEESDIAKDFDIGLERILRKNGDGKAVSLAGSPNARDGARTSFQVFDEPLAIDTPIATPDGWSSMSQLKAGDRVFGTKGQVCTVLGGSEMHEGRPCYRLTFDDGSSVVADAGHVWWVHRRGGCGHGRGCRCKTSQGWQPRKTADLIDVRQRDGAFTYHVPATQPIELPERNLPIDPYVLGLWLGDGDSTNATISAGQADVDEIESAIRCAGYAVTRCAVRSGFAPLLYITFLESRPSGCGAVAGAPQNYSVVGELRGLGLLRNKHIPSMYLRASLAQRLALLQGLMDADGHVMRGGYCTFVNTSEAIVEGVAELLRSLGCPPSVRWRRDTRKESYKAVAKVNFQCDLQVFRLARKRERLVPRRSSAARAIVSVEPVASVPVRCIAVDSDDHLFLAGRGMVPTHNTHWHTLARLKQAHQTMMANLPKRKGADAWALEITTAPEPGTGSIAEDTMEYARAIDEGRITDASLFFFHRQASDGHDLSTAEGARAAVIEASGPAAAWRDIDGIVSLWSDPTTDRAYWERVYCNRLVKGASQAFNVEAWKALAVAAPQRPARGALITLGFDGAMFHDATGLVATDVATGYQWLAGGWECPLGGEQRTPPWQVPTDEVDGLVRQLFSEFTVWRLYADPPYWQSWIALWRGLYGEERVIEWWTNRRKPMTSALENFDTAIKEKRLLHDGDARLQRHIGNARREDLKGWRDEQGKPLWLIRKERTDSPHKIDFAMAAVLSWEAHTDAIAAGAKVATQPNVEVWG